ncbi:MAG: TetR/AcrR family transcriptional regulator [Microthrixaceae bacterium]
MIDITGGTTVGTAAGVPGATATRADHVPSENAPTEDRVLDAVVACAARWGIDKTTVDDVAREAGVSRATVYRLFPGGKATMVHLTTDREVTALLETLASEVSTCDDVSDALVHLVTGGSRLVAEQPAVAYMRTHEPAALRRFFSFRHLDRILALTAGTLGPSLERFVEPRAARELVTWLTRLVVSYFLNPDPARDLARPDAARELVESHVMPLDDLRARPCGVANP